MQLGQVIRERRAMLGLTQHALSVKSGVAYYTIRALETGTQRTTTFQIALALLKALDVPESQLYEIAEQGCEV